MGYIFSLRNVVDDMLWRFPKRDIPRYLLRGGAAGNGGSVLDQPEGRVGSFPNHD